MGKIVDLARKRFWNTEIFELIESEIERLEKVRVPPEPMSSDVPTDKDRPFQVGDTIELRGGGLRIVLGKKSEREMELLDVETGDRWWSSCPSNYTLVYRPRSPKPEPTVKEEIATDKDGNPEGGLKRGDLIWSSCWECHGIFDYANQPSIYGWWAPNKSHGYRGGYDWFWRESVSFVSRPRFPDRKEIGDHG